MGRALEIVFPRRCATFQARLLEGLAPRTCQLLWDHLPIEEETYHTRRSGCELFIITPSWPELPGQENATMFAETGDIFFYFQPGYPDAPLHLKERGLRDYVHLGFFYGRDSQPTGPFGPMAGNRFAVFRENLSGFAAVAQKTRQEGYETLILRRGE
jgi:hypothetical protein